MVDEKWCEYRKKMMKKRFEKWSKNDLKNWWDNCKKMMWNLWENYFKKLWEMNENNTKILKNNFKNDLIIIWMVYKMIRMISKFYQKVL